MPSNPAVVLMPRTLLPLLLTLATLLFLPGGCSHKPLAAVSPSDYPRFSDDLDYRGLDAAITRSLSHLRRLPPSTRYTLGRRNCTAGELIRALEFFRRLVARRPAPASLNTLIARYFEVYQARGLSGFNPERNMLVTGYYQPLLNGSLKPTGEYRYPLYKVPNDLVIRHIAAGRKDRVVGRMEEGRFLPYWTRGEIETNQLLAGQELVWLRDPMDAFTLHIQGSGLIALTDGSILAVHYAMRNGREYRSIGKYMVDNGMMELEEASLQAIRSYIAAHPENRDRILHHNASFIFFEPTTTHGAIGALGQELTPGRSIAADRSCFPPGALAFLRSRKPVISNGRVVKWDDLQRFVTIQDTGSAIRGPGRVDLFWGTGAEAGMAAGRMKEDGALFLLLLKPQQG